jgi:hypothetical protein
MREHQRLPERHSDDLKLPSLPAVLGKDSELLGLFSSTIVN